MAVRPQKEHSQYVFRPGKQIQLSAKVHRQEHAYHHLFICKSKCSLVHKSIRGLQEQAHMQLYCSESEQVLE
uniref:Uncharacterized protein n=1 Tax=Setaria italica TaxID=4555 RepID=K3ZM82_SETIT